MKRTKFHQMYSLLRNILEGANLAISRRYTIDRFYISSDQLVLLILLNLLLLIGTGYLQYLPNPNFNKYAISNYSLNIICFLFASYLVCKLLGNVSSALKLIVIIFSASPAFYLMWRFIQFTSEKLPDGANSTIWSLYAIYLAWLIIILLRSIQLVTEKKGKPIIQGVAIYCIIWLAPVLYYGDAEFWYTAYDEYTDSGPLSSYRNIDVESLFYAQPELMQSTLSNLQSQRIGQSDLYFIGFAGYAREDVFLKEVEYAKQLFEKKYDANGRTIALINNLSTIDHIPLATVTNLNYALRHIGDLMDTEEDTLVLFLTSHGSKDHGLSVDFWPLDLNQVTPEKLRSILDDAGIKWRIIIVSACYSGGYVKPLEDPNTVIMTAAASGRKSFGCGTDRDFTYFGEALFKDRLGHSQSIIEAFHLANDDITKREIKEGRKPSLPQLFVGSAIRDRLSAIEAETRSRK